MGSGMRTWTVPIILILMLGSFYLAYMYLDIGAWASFQQLKEDQVELQRWYRDHTLLALGAFFAAYVVATLLSIPVGVLLSMAGGAIFGFWVGFLLVLLAATSGATLAFLVARYLLRDLLWHRMHDRVAALDRGVQREGPFYLFALRLIPIMPFWLINLGMGITSMRTWRYCWVSALGMLPGSAIYVNAGTQLGELESPTGILTPELVVSFLLLAIFPLAARYLVRWLHRYLPRWVRRPAAGAEPQSEE
jgi:uncharacterized membrane protein YdjX (TVP38/TMEM64 family)